KQWPSYGGRCSTVESGHDRMVRTGNDDSPLCVQRAEDAGGPDRFDADKTRASCSVRFAIVKDGGAGQGADPDGYHDAGRPVGAGCHHLLINFGENCGVTFADPVWNDIVTRPGGI